MSILKIKWVGKELSYPCQRLIRNTKAGAFLLLQVEPIGASRGGRGRQQAGGRAGREAAQRGSPRRRNPGATASPPRPGLCSASRAWKWVCFRERAAGGSLRCRVGCRPPPALGHSPVSCPPWPPRRPWPPPSPSYLSSIPGARGAVPTAPRPGSRASYRTWVGLCEKSHLVRFCL